MNPDHPTRLTIWHWHTALHLAGILLAIVGVTAAVLVLA